MIVNTEQGAMTQLRAQGIQMYDPSMLKSYLWCPRGYYYRHERGLARKEAGSAPGMNFGTGCHHATESWYPTKKNDQEALQKFIEFFN